MLRRLRIENLVLIREAELELAPGLNAITGETGAGKTILAQAVGLLLGTKGDESLVGPAGEEAYVEAELTLPEELEELADLRPEDEDGLLVARRLSATRRPRGPDPRRRRGRRRPRRARRARGRSGRAARTRARAGRRRAARRRAAAPGDRVGPSLLSRVARVRAGAARGARGDTRSDRRGEAA